MYKLINKPDTAHKTGLGYVLYTFSYLKRLYLFTKNKKKRKINSGNFNYNSLVFSCSSLAL